MGGFSYQRLFNTKIVHNFYEHSVSKKDLAVVPTVSTGIAMKNSNMLFRNDEGGFRVLYKADEDGDPFIDFRNVRLTFTLQLLNVNEFLNFTNLDDGSKEYAAGKILYFNNIGSITTSVLDYSLIDYLRPVTFTYTFPMTAKTTPNPVDLGNIIIKDQAGNVVTPDYPASTGITADENGNYKYPIDFTKLPKGLYKFETWTTNRPTHKFERIYIDNEMVTQGVFGIVDIMAKNAKDSSYPALPDYRTYQMQFVRRTTQWKYIVVLKSPGVNPVPPPLVPIVIDIEDVAVQSPYGELFFNDAIDGEVNGLPAKIITSVSTTIPYYEVPKRGLSIIKDGADTVLTDIPGPPLGVVSAEAGNFGITEIFVLI